MADHHTALSTAAVLGLLVSLVPALGYLAAVRRTATGRRWPRTRTGCWLAGLAVLLVGSVGPVAAAGDTSFPAHAVSHLLVGMLGPLLLVLGAPVTLALRTLTTATGRRLTRALRSRAVRWLTEPVVAAALAVGGLWLLYTTPLFTLAEQYRGVHLLVHLHLVLSGYLLPAVLVGPDPLPHRRSYPHRAAVLVAALAAHGILAKHLYTQPPAAFAPDTAPIGAMVMYYGGDAVELVVIVLLCRRWFGVRQPRPAGLGPA